MVPRVLALPLVFGSLLVCLISNSYAQQPDAAEGPPATTPANAPSSADVSQKAKTASAAATAVQEAVRNVAHLTALANDYQKAVSDITGTAANSKKSPLQDLRTLQAVVQAVQQQGSKGLFDLLASAGKALDSTKPESAEARRVSACADLDKAASAAAPQRDATDAQAACTRAAADASAAAPTPGPASTALQDTLRGIYKFVQDRVAVLSDKVKPLQNDKLGAGSKPDAAILIDALTTGMPALKSVLEDRQLYQSMWESTKSKLDSLLSTPAADPKHVADCKAIQSVEDSFSCLQASVDAITPQLSGWFAAIQSDLQTSAAALDSRLADVAGDPSKNAAEANGAVRDQSEKIASVQPILDAWPPLVGFLKDRQPDSFSLKSTKAALASLQTVQNTLRGSVSRMHDALAGDMTQFETDQVSLYYFTDVRRLMSALNENTQTIGGVAEAQAQAAAQRTALTQTELDLADAQAAVNRYQKQVQDLQEQQRQLMAKLKSQDSALSRLSSRLNSAQNAKATADQAVKNAQPSDQDASKPVDTSKVDAKQAAEAKNLSQAQSDYDAAKKQRDDTQSQLDNSQNQSDNLPSKLEAAQQALSGAQAAVSQDRRKMLMAAQAESDAFAFARDNTPYLYAPADASSSDPAKRVILYAYNDSKTIFMRGKPDDLLIVKDIIAKFDQPAPQARLTLWTFQLNADSNRNTNKDAAKKLNDSMAIVDEELSTTRAMVNTTLTLFRKSINDEVQRVESETLAAVSNWTYADVAKWRRTHVYNEEVLHELHFDLASPELKILRQLIPDPSGTTTLGEALMILSLAKPEIQSRVRNKIETNLSEELKHLPPLKDGRPISDFLPRDLSTSLALTWKALAVPQAESPHTSLSASQLEISRALHAAYSTAEFVRITNQFRSWSQEATEIAGVEEQLSAKQDEIEAQAMSKLSPKELNDLKELQTSVDLHKPERARLNAKQTLTERDSKDLAVLLAEKAGADRLLRLGIARIPRAEKDAYARQAEELSTLRARMATITVLSGPSLKALRDEFGYNAEIPLVQKGSDRWFQLRMDWLRLFPPNITAPRVAAADQMLKEMIIAVEDDLDRLFIQPMISRLRSRLTSDKRVRVGILQRESLLATNRGLARIDPRGSAQLAVGDEQDILTGIQQLAQLYATVQSGGALAAIGALQQQPREPQPEIYALTTGNRFQVTPVFDPSGQALRFKFDFVATTNLQEPNGTTNPQLPRVERHTINTEVQLSNLETREISRFEANAKLGLPETYWGGIPIIKDIPGVRKPWFPLIGWFVRKAGSNSSAQQSVIFGQTTIYPTISSMVDLLTQIHSNDAPNVTNGAQP